jgi:hypothetical protein
MEYPENQVASLQTQITSLQTTNDNLKANLESLQINYSNLQNQLTNLENLQNQLTNLQNVVNNIKPGSQVVVKTGFVSNGGFIPIPDTYNETQCKVIIGLSTIEHNVVGNLVVYSFPSATFSNPPYFTNIITEITPDTTKNGFDVKITNSTSQGNAPFTGNLAYMLIGVKNQNHLIS